MTGVIQGRTINGEIIWITEWLEENKSWIGTASTPPTLLVRHTDAKAAIEFFLSWCNYTFDIVAHVNDKYGEVILDQVPMGSKMGLISQRLHLE